MELAEARDAGFCPGATGWDCRERKTFAPPFPMERLGLVYGAIDLRLTPAETIAPPASPEQGVR
jgi:hypothetical protein